MGHLDQDIAQNGRITHLKNPLAFLFDSLMQASASANAAGLRDWRTMCGQSTCYVISKRSCDTTNHSPSIAADALRFNNAAVISSNDDLACSHAGFPIDSPTEREYRAPASR